MPSKDNKATPVSAFSDRLKHHGGPATHGWPAPEGESKKNLFNLLVKYYAVDSGSTSSDEKEPRTAAQELPLLFQRARTLAYHLGSVSDKLVAGGTKQWQASGLVNADKAREHHLAVVGAIQKEYPQHEIAVGPHPDLKPKHFAAAASPNVISAAKAFEAATYVTQESQHLLSVAEELCHRVNLAFKTEERLTKDNEGATTLLLDIPNQHRALQDYADAHKQLASDADFRHKPPQPWKGSQFTFVHASLLLISAQAKTASAFAQLMCTTNYETAVQCHHHINTLALHNCKVMNSMSSHLAASKQEGFLQARLSSLLESSFYKAAVFVACAPFKTIASHPYLLFWVFTWIRDAREDVRKEKAQKNEDVKLEMATEQLKLEGRRVTAQEMLAQAEADKAKALDTQNKLKLIEIQVCRQRGLPDDFLSHQQVPLALGPSAAEDLNAHMPGQQPFHFAGHGAPAAAPHHTLP